MATALQERELTLSQAALYVARLRGKAVTYETIRLWTTEGRKGVVLESWQVGGLIKTSEEAIDRFNNALTNLRNGRRPAPPNVDQKANDAARTEIKRRFGI